jgi:hypothetical protein
VNTPAPLLSYHRIVQFVPGSSLADVAKEFSPSKANPVICLIGNSSTVTRADRACKRFVTKRRGGYLTLQWIDQGFLEILREDAGSGATEPELPDDPTLTRLEEQNGE